MQLNAYLSFRGECEAAFKFHEECLGGKLGAIFRYAGTPLADQVPAFVHGFLATARRRTTWTFRLCGIVDLLQPVVLATWSSRVSSLKN